MNRGARKASVAAKIAPKVMDADKPKVVAKPVFRYSFWWEVPGSVNPKDRNDMIGTGHPMPGDKDKKKLEKLPKCMFEVLCHWLLLQPNFAAGFKDKQVVGAEWSIITHPTNNPWPEKPDNPKRDFDNRFTEKVPTEVKQGKRKTLTLQVAAPEFITQLFLHNVGGPQAIFSLKRDKGKPIYPDGMAARAAFCWPTRNLLFSYPGGLWNTVLPVQTSPPREKPVEKPADDPNDPYAKYAIKKKSSVDITNPPGPMADGATPSSPDLPRIMVQILWWGQRPKSAHDLPPEMHTDCHQMAFDLVAG